jgi:sugar diacid utilization regulator
VPRERYDEISRRHEALAAQHSALRRLALLAGGAGGLSAIVEACAELTGKPAVLFDTRDRRVASAGSGRLGAGSVPPVARVLAAVAAAHERAAGAPPGPVTVAADPLRGLARRHLLVPVTAADEPFGWLVMAEYPSRLRELDEFVAARAAEQLGAEYSVQRRIARVAWNARSSLARQLVRGSLGTDDLRGSAEYLGVDTGARRILVYVIGPGRPQAQSADGEALATAVGRRLKVEVLATRGSEGTLLLVEAPRDAGYAALVSRVKTAVRAALHALPGLSAAIVGISSVCEPEGLSHGYREAREVARCVNRFGGDGAARILAADDLGPARLFIAHGDSGSVQAYAGEVLGPLLTDAVMPGDLLLTLHVYFDCGRSVRLAAAELRVRVATGLDVAADANDQLSVQTALLVLRLHGHPALPALGEAAHGSVRNKTA